MTTFNYIFTNQTKSHIEKLNFGSKFMSTARKFQTNCKWAIIIIDYYNNWFLLKQNAIIKIKNFYVLLEIVFKTEHQRFFISSTLKPCYLTLH